MSERFKERLIACVAGIGVGIFLDICAKTIEPPHTYTVTAVERVEQNFMHNTYWSFVAVDENGKVVTKNSNELVIVGMKISK